MVITLVESRRIHEASSGETQKADDDHPKRTAGQLSTKVESGEDSEHVQTSDPGMQMQDGEPLLMSCAPLHVARMNVLGVQG